MEQSLLMARYDLQYMISLSALLGDFIGILNVTKGLIKIGLSHSYLESYSNQI